MLVADIVTLLIPLWILLGLVVLLGTFALVARIDNGRYVRPIFTGMAKVPFLRKWLQKASTAAIERSNPELASAMKKMERHAKHLHDPVQAQKAMSQLTRDERRALLEMQEQQAEQGNAPQQAMNRDMRRRMEKAQKNARRGR
jgi:hypothetical protein